MSLLEDIASIASSGKECVIATIVSAKGATPGKVSFKMIIFPDGKTSGTVGGGDLEKRAIEDAVEIMHTRESKLVHYNLDKLRMECGGDVSIFYDYISPRKMLYVFGGGHIGQSLYKLAKVLGQDIKIFDNRKELSKAFDNADFVLCDFEKIPLQYIGEVDSYVIIMTHKHGFDYSVLKQIVESGKEFRYIGLIGSAKKIRANCASLVKDGLEIPDNLYAPIGLNIGAESPAEIAVSVIGEIIGVSNNTDVDSLRKRISRN